MGQYSNSGILFLFLQTKKATKDLVSFVTFLYLKI